MAAPLLFRQVSVGLSSAAFVLGGVWLTGLLFGVEVRCGAQLTAMAYLAFWAGRTFGREQVLRWWWLVPLFLWGEHRFDPVMAGGGLFIALPMLGIALGIGYAVRGSDRRARQLEEAAGLLRREQAHTAELAAAAERLRVSEKLQEAVDGRLAEILDRVGVVDGTTVPGRLAAVEDIARDALDRLRLMLLDLRAPTPADALAEDVDRPVPAPSGVADRRQRWGSLGLATIVLLCTVELADILFEPGTEVSLMGLPVAQRVSIVLATAALIAAALMSRRWPVAAVAVQAAVGPALIVTGPQVDYLPTSSLLAISVVTYTAGSRLPRRPAVAVLVLLLCSWLVAEFGFGAGVPVPGYAVVGPWLAGRAIRSSRRLVTDLQAVHAELDAERIRQVELGTRVERRQLLGEVHDVLGGALSVVLVQAAGGRRLAAADPGAAVGAARTITDTVRHARAQVAVLRARPKKLDQPDTVESVVRRMRQAGMSVTVTGYVSTADLRGDIAVVLAWIVQESLTNALRYAGGADVTVELRRDGDGVVVAVTNGPPPPGAVVLDSGTGLGLVAMAERVTALCGVLEYGPVIGGWRVRAQLPAVSQSLLTVPG